MTQNDVSKKTRPRRAVMSPGEIIRGDRRRCGVSESSVLPRSRCRHVRGRVVSGLPASRVLHDLAQLPLSAVVHTALLRICE
jgi:hypothetical protein